MIKLRPAKIDDVQSVVRILTTSRAEYVPYAKSVHSLEETRKWVAQSLLTSHYVVLAEYNGINVGVLATNVADEYGWIDQLYLAPGFVGQGIGKVLLDYAFKVLPRPIRLWTFQENKRAIKFYEKNGFSSIKYTDGEENEEKCPCVLYELR